MLSNTKFAIQIVGVGFFLIIAIRFTSFVMLVPNFAVGIRPACVHDAVIIMTRFEVVLPAFFLFFAEPTEELCIVSVSDS